MHCTVLLKLIYKLSPVHMGHTAGENSLRKLLHPLTLSSSGQKSWQPVRESLRGESAESLQMKKLKKGNPTF